MLNLLNVWVKDEEEVTQDVIEFAKSPWGMWDGCWFISEVSTVKIYHSKQFSHSVLSDSLRPPGLQQARLPCPSPPPGAYSKSYPLSQWCHPITSSSVIPFFSRLQSFPASGSFQMSQFFTSGGKIIGVSASVSVLPINIQDWFTLEWTGWISLQSKGLSRVFSSTTVQKHQLPKCITDIIRKQFFGTRKP